MSTEESLDRHLRRHAARRSQGMPTVSVVLGTCDLRLSQLTRTIAAQGDRALVLRTDAASDLARAWLDDVARAFDLRERALALATRADPDAQAAFRARSEVERRAWLSWLSEHAADETARAAARWLADRMEDESPVPHAELLAVTAWLPRVAWPVPCVITDAPHTLEELAALCNAAPSVPLCVIMSRTAWHGALPAISTRARALLSEGVIALEEGDSDWAVRNLRDEALAARDAARTSSGRSPDEAAYVLDRARSLAERLLYHLLQGRGETRGLFELNGLAGFDFGARRAEIDLVSTALSLALEVDGYHHFKEPAAYRRDRRKDVLLQTHGYWVMRVLADDVLDRGDEVVNAVCELVQKRKANRANGGNT